MSQNLSIQGSPSPTVMTQQTAMPAPTTSGNVYLALAVVCAIVLVASIIFMDYLDRNYFHHQKTPTEAWANGALAGCIVVAGFSMIGFFASLSAFQESKELEVK